MRQLQTGLSAYFDFYNCENRIKVSTSGHQLNGTMRSDRRYRSRPDAAYFPRFVVQRLGPPRFLLWYWQQLSPMIC